MKQQGYTLLEVLVATAVFGIFAVAMMSALSTSTQNAARVTGRDRATLLAGQKMDELLIAKTVPLNVPFESQWDPSLTGAIPCGWRALITTFEAGETTAGASDLQRVQLEVWWGPENDRHTFQLTGYRRGTLSEAEAAARSRARNP